MKERFLACRQVGAIGRINLYPNLQSLWGRAIESTMIMNIVFVCQCFDILILYQKGHEQPDGIDGLKILRYGFLIANQERAQFPGIESLELLNLRSAASEQSRQKDIPAKQIRPHQLQSNAQKKAGQFRKNIGVLQLDLSLAMR